MVKTNQAELDSVLQVLENPVRRRIIKRLSQEAAYGLQISKELGLGQALVAKHMAIMERAGLVASSSEPSPSGPARRRYSLARSISITMDVASNIYIEHATVLGEAPKARPSQKVASMSGRVQNALDAPGDDKARISKLSQVLLELDKALEEAEAERVALIGVRNRAMGEAARIAGKQSDADRKRVLFHILDEHDTEVGSISSSLNIRELVVRAILDEFEKNLFE
ncbi:MAG: helix-turn-helix domain-containing protein [Thaumarchaeota archaeon]|nr:helix-turn-helix domain-containing protein [Nitrososphaerota archaeon]